MKLNIEFSNRHTAILLGCILCSNSWAQSTDDSSKEKFDRVWSYASLHQNENNNFVFTGRFQYDYAIVEGEFEAADGKVMDAPDFSDGGTRRLRMGFKWTTGNITLHAEGDFRPEGEDEFYNRLTDTYISWSRSKELKFTLGKHSIPFTLDGSTSSKSLLTIDRNNVSNNLWFPVEYLPGASASGQKENWKYHAGVYSASTDEEFGDLDTGWAYLGSVGYDLSSGMGVDTAFVKFDYVYTDPGDNLNFDRQLKNVASVSFQLKNGKMGVRTDLASGKGYDKQGNIWGAIVMPFYNFSNKLQMVGRYTYVRSDEPGDVRYSRYESRVFNARGDNYNELYFGLNWFLYSHKFKLQTGIKHVNMNDSNGQNGGNYDGYDWTTAFRMSW